jgi:glycosyltransferase involved in cell wall biosynthesis
MTSRPFLSAAIIVRDEARHIGDCLRSITGLVDEAVVVDTGSTDGTGEFARDLGARVHSVAWQDDFAAARNEALDRARGDWILYIDADERVRTPGPSPARVRALLARPELAACYVRLHARVDYTAYRELRLFRNDPRVRFEGVIHENIWPGVLRYMEAANGEIADSGLVLDHLGYEGPQDHKHARNLPLLLRELERDPEHVYCWYHLGVIRRELGDRDGARAALHAAVAAGRRGAPPTFAEGVAWVELVHLELAAHENSGGGSAESVLADALERFPDHASLLWLKAQLLMRDGTDLDEAIAILSRLRRWRPEVDAPDEGFGYDQRLFGVLPCEGLAACHFRLGRYAEAERYFALAAAYEPERLEYRVKRQLCAKLARARGRQSA